MKRRRNQQLSPVGSPPSDNESGNAYDSSREQDRFLPVANVSRIMKKALPTNAKISKEAKGMVQECVSEFISFITGEASEKCQREKRKIVNGDDLLWAMTTLGFENYVAPLKVYLNKYRETEGAKNSVARLGDQSLADEGEMKNSSSDPGATDVHPMTSNASLPGFNSGFYSVTGYGEQYRTGAFDMSGINGGGEANGGSALRSHLHGDQ